MAFYANGYNTLEVFAQADGEGGGIFLHVEREDEQLFQPAGVGHYRRLSFPLRQGVACRVQAQNCRVSLAYLCGGKEMAARGIAFLSKNLEHLLSPQQLAEHYNTPYRESFHFSPYTGWMNDPNGLCWHNGLYHAFYQYNPHSQQWGNMYWGHAVSEDLMHWRHLPVALEPQPGLLARQDMVGGAFSGSAVPKAEGICLFYTRHEENRKNPGTLRETQWSAFCRDGLHPQAEKLLIDGPAPGGARDIRDPKVGMQNNTPYMVLGSAIQGRAAVLLYTAAQLEGPWEYRGPLFYPKDAGPASIVECPDLFELDGRHVLLESTTQFTDSCGRIQPVRYHIGHVNGAEFHAESSGLLDFGGNFYAAQSFLHEGRRLMLGWVNDFYAEHRCLPLGACGSFSLPRELAIENNALLCRPAKEVYGLKSRCLYQGRGENIQINSIPGNAYYVNINLQPACDFELCLALEGGDRLVVFQRGAAVGLHSSRVQQVEFLSAVSNVHAIEIFYDRRTAEVYLNNGQAVGTKTFYTKTASGCFHASFSAPENVYRAEVWCMGSIWKQ